MNPVDIARRLIAVATEAEAAEIVIDDLGSADDQERLWLGEFGVRENLQRPSAQLIGALREALRETGWNPDLRDIPQSERNRWTWGEAMIFRGPDRRIVRGSLVPTRKVPILRRVPDDVALYLITIDEGESFLDRENHNMGWHYHYLDWRKDRSNVILSWDTRWAAPAPQTTPPAIRGLFAEPHGNSTNADFIARPELWGPKKRVSMYRACSGDLGNWPIDEFKCASDNSDVVYPPGARLTPHPAAHVVAIRKSAASTRSIKRRRR